jgi:hypothetical protein
MRALCSSPVAGFFMGSTSDSIRSGIRIVACRFSRSTLKVIAQVRWWLEKISPAGPAFGARDLTKVAQYEVLGNEAKDRSVPAGTIEMLGLLVLHAAQRLPAFVDRPVSVRDG